VMVGLMFSGIRENISPTITAVAVVGLLMYGRQNLPRATAAKEGGAGYMVQRIGAWLKGNF